MATARTSDKSAASTASSTYLAQMAYTRYQDSPTILATAANGICRASMSTRASNNRVKPFNLPTQSHPPPPHPTDRRTRPNKKDTPPPPPPRPRAPPGAPGGGGAGRAGGGRDWV